MDAIELRDELCLGQIAPEQYFASHHEKICLAGTPGGNEVLHLRLVRRPIAGEPRAHGDLQSARVGERTDMHEIVGCAERSDPPRIRLDDLQ